MFEKLKGFWNKYVKRDREQLKQVLSIDGHRFYVIDALPNYCVNRFFYFVSKNEELANLGIPLEYFMSIADQLDVLVDSPKLKQAIPQLTGMLRYAVGKEQNKWYHLTVAVVEAFVLIDDEPLNEISMEHNKLKRELLVKHPECRFFFTNIATEYLKSLENTFNISEFEEFWKEMITAPELNANIGI